MVHWNATTSDGFGALAIRKESNAGPRRQTPLVLPDVSETDASAKSGVPARSELHETSHAEEIFGASERTDVAGIGAANEVRLTERNLKASSDPRRMK